ncbi:MAG: hypothetical protein EPO20_02885 [Betaproteobacteria bacterium]|nr:MAG: hypothetical protein EPO20_02885 [Betaproteobacteria bacterium]
MAADASKGGAPGASNPAAIEKFISRWNAASGPERANYQLFLTALNDDGDLPEGIHVAAWA